MSLEIELSKKYKTAVQLQQEFDGEIEAHQLQERIDIEDEFDKATKVHDECLSAKQAQKLNNRLNK